MSENKNGYSLSRDWFNFAVDNPDIVSGNHTALYMWLIELNNRLNWVKKFGVTYRECMDGMSCKSRNTYMNCFKDLVTWGFIKVIKPGVNQYQCSIIAILKNEQAQVKQISKHRSATVASTVASTDTIPKTVKTSKHINSKNIYSDFIFFKDDFFEVWNQYLEMRKKIKKPATQAAETLALKKVSQLSNDDLQLAVKIVQQSILNSWQGIFELKINNLTNNKNGTSNSFQPAKRGVGKL